jgi:hypothetical protein
MVSMVSMVSMVLTRCHRRLFRHRRRRRHRRLRQHGWNRAGQRPPPSADVGTTSSTICSPGWQRSLWTLPLVVALVALAVLAVLMLLLVVLVLSIL